MRLSNFELKETNGTSPMNLEFIAEVDVETGFLFWKKTKRRTIKRKYAEYWYFVYNGKFTPGSQAEELARSWEAMTGQKC